MPAPAPAVAAVVLVAAGRPLPASECLPVRKELSAFPVEFGGVHAVYLPVRAPGLGASFRSTGSSPRQILLAAVTASGRCSRIRFCGRFVSERAADWAKEELLCVNLIAVNKYRM